jgi:hypothetical protein
MVAPLSFEVAFEVAFAVDGPFWRPKMRAPIGGVFRPGVSFGEFARSRDAVRAAC